MALLKLNSRGDLVASDEPRHRDPGRTFRSTFAWQQARREQIRRAPHCAVCGATSRLTADHIVPLAAGGDPLDETNLRTLCLRHNSAKGSR